MAFESKKKQISKSLQETLKDIKTPSAVETFELSKQKMFSWLDKTKTPYFFILNPIFNYGAGIDYNSYFSKRFGYKKEKSTGIQNVDIASDYAIYTLFG